MSESIKVIARNRRARHDYDIQETYEAGLVLMGSEIKSIRAGRVNLSEGYVQHKNEELWLINTHIAPYEEAGIYGHEPLRARKLLLHRREIEDMFDATRMKGFTLVPLQLHLRHGLAKLDIAVGRGKRQYDKRETLRRKDAKRQIDRALKERSR